MKRSYLRALLVVAIVASVAFVFVRGRDHARLRDVLDLARLNGEALPELVQRIRDFRRIVTRDGQKLLEVSALEASYFRDDSGVEIVQPSLVFFNEGEKVGSISGERGRLMLDGNDVKSVEMTGDVSLSLVQFEIRAESLIYERARNAVVANGPAVIRSPELELTGEGMVLDLDTKTLRIDEAVDMTLRRIMRPREVRKVTVTEPLE